MKNDNGFTLVELLAVVTILGIILVATIPAVNRWINKGKNESLNSQKETLIIAAKSYSEDHSNVLPKTIGDSSKITAQVLKDKRYLKEDILNADKQSCMDNSYVEVYKNKRNSYKYSAYLYCGDDPVPVPDPTSEDSFIPNIMVEFSDKDNNVNYSNNVAITSVKITIDGGEDKEGNLLKVGGYSYVISVNNSNDSSGGYHEIFNSGSLQANGKDNLVIETSLSNYLDITTFNNFAVTVIAYNEKGYRLEKTFYSSYKDSVKPICGRVSKEAKDNEWNNLDRRTITVECSDGDGSGCVKDSYTKTFTADMDIGYITISDNAGNTTDCPVKVHLDRKKPTVIINAYKRNSNGTPGVNVGTVKADHNTPNVTLNRYDYGYGSSGWLNLINYPYGIYYEIIVSDEISLYKGTWSENASGLTSSSSNINKFVKTDSRIYTSQNNKASYALVDDGFRKAKFVFSDKASNSVTVNIVAPIDRIGPTVTAAKSNLNTEEGVTVTVSCRDSISGCQDNSIVYPKTTTTQKYYALDNAGNSNNSDSAPSIVVSSYPCHPTERECGSYVCGVSYYCASDESIDNLDECEEIGTKDEFCKNYCKDYKTCYQ